MKLSFYQAKSHLTPATPDEEYRQHEQALINALWDNTTQVITVFEQDGIGSDEYFPIEVRVDYAIEMGTSFKQDDDFKHFAFKNLEHFTTKGIMYQYDDDYWLTINTAELGSVIKDITVRRCNNIMRWVNPINGALNELPCCIEYVLESPSVLKDKDVMVANGHITVICQGNDLTRKLPKNTRFIFNGEPYKFVATQNMLNEGIKDNMASNLLYLDMYLDTEQPDDDMVCNIANAKQWDYGISLSPFITQQVTGFKGTVFPTVTLNGEVVGRDVEFHSNYACAVDTNGNFELTGEAGQVAIITANLAGNVKLAAEIRIEIVEEIEDRYELVIEPYYEAVRVGQSIDYTVNLYKNGTIEPAEIQIETDNMVDEQAYSLVQQGNNVTIFAYQLSTKPLSLTYSLVPTDEENEPLAIPITQQIYLKAMF